MGPNILLDKSALQSLSQREIYRLAAHYNLVTAPILIIEILADLKKETTGDELSTAQVQQLADKVLGGSYACAHHELLLVNDLLGDHVPLTGQVPMTGGRVVKNRRGEKGVIFDPSPEDEATLRWREGKFEEAEILLAQRWRDATTGIDLESFQREHKDIFKGHRFKNLDNLYRYVTFITQPNAPSEKERLLNGILDEFRIQPDAREYIARRWHEHGRPSIQDFAPYAAHCFRVNLVFQYGVITRLITTRRTNRVDIEYLYYAPFCQVFTSRDNLHRDLANSFLRPDQSFVDGDDLKKDLATINQWWDNLNEEQRREYSAAYGSYPPRNSGSVTHQMWSKHMKPWQPGAGNRAANMTKEEEQALLAEIKDLWNR